MGKEKALLSFIAIFIGLLVAGVAFYFYESSKNTQQVEEIKTAVTISPSPTPLPPIFLTINKPIDEQVVAGKTVAISGKTTSDATVIILTESFEEILTPSSNGDFSSTLTIDNGQNLIEITAIAPNGEKVKVLRTVTFSTEEF